METNRHSLHDCECGHEDAMHVTGGHLPDLGITCRACNMENLFARDFLSDAGLNAPAHRAFLAERLTLADDATLDAAFRSAYLKFTKTRRDDFLFDWQAHVASLKA
jgi:hypothetical protein